MLPFLHLTKIIFNITFAYIMGRFTIELPDKVISFIDNDANVGRRKRKAQAELIIMSHYGYTDTSKRPETRDEISKRVASILAKKNNQTE